MTARPRVYLDHHATTPVDPRVASVVLGAMTENFGNANSIDHAYGVAANALIQSAALSVAELVDAEAANVRFTSGSTEAIRFVVAHWIQRAHRRRIRIALTRVEHRAVLDAVIAATETAGAEIAWIDVDHRARIDLDCLDAVISKGIDALCVMAANNEVGTVYPVGECTARAHAAGATVLVDATQAAGRVPLSMRQQDIDYLVLSAHKMYGPKGVGALVTADPIVDEPWQQGTPNVPGIAGFGEACRLRRLEMADDERDICRRRDALESALVAQIPGLVINGDRVQRLSNNLHISIPDAPNDAIVARLRETVAISTGAACVSGTHAPSHVLRAMGLAEHIQEGALRIGLGKFNTDDEIEWAAARIALAAEEVRLTLSRNTQR